MLNNPHPQKQKARIVTDCTTRTGRTTIALKPAVNSCISINQHSKKALKLNNADEGAIL